MASFTLAAPQQFPQGTVVGVYPPPSVAGAERPSSGAITTAVMGAASVTFTDLVDGRDYVAAALVGGTWRMVRFTAGQDVSAEARLETDQEFTGDNTFSGAVNLPDATLGHINVRDPDYGAVGDGVTDDSAAIQAAINRAYANALSSGPRTVFIPADNYICNVIIKPYVILRGEGHWASGLRSAPGSAAPVIGSQKNPGADYSLDPMFPEIRDLFIDGNKDNGATGHGIELVGSNNDLPQGGNRAPRIYNVRIQNCGGDGLILGFTMGNFMLRNLFVALCVGNGIMVKPFDSFISDCDVGVCGDGIVLGDGVAGGGAIMVSNTKSWWHGDPALGGSGTGHGFKIQSPRNQLSGCQTQDNFGGGYALIGNATASTPTENKIVGTAGGDSDGSVILDATNGDVAYNHIDVRTVWADRVGAAPTTEVALIGDSPEENILKMGTGGGQTGALAAPYGLYTESGGAQALKNRISRDDHVLPIAVDGPYNGEPAYQNSWASGAGGRGAGFQRVGHRVTFFGGLNDAGGAATEDTVAFTLPPGFRPPAAVILACPSGAALDAIGLIAIGMNGEVKPGSGGVGSSKWSLEGLSFSLW